MPYRLSTNVVQHSKNDPEKAKARHRTLMKHMPAKPNPSPSSSVASLPLRNRPSIEVTPDQGFANDNSSEGDINLLTPKTEDGQHQRHGRHPRSISSMNGHGRRESSQHSQPDFDPMDYQMDDSRADRRGQVDGVPLANGLYQGNYSSPAHELPSTKGPPRPDVLPPGPLHSPADSSPQAKRFSNGSAATFRKPVPPVEVFPPANEAPPTNGASPVAVFSPLNGASPAISSPSLPKASHQFPHNQRKSFRGGDASSFEPSSTQLNHVDGPKIAEAGHTGQSALWQQEAQRPQEPGPVIEDPVPSKAHPGWDFILPTLPAPTSLAPGRGGAGRFDIAALVAALQHGADEVAVQTYFNYFDSTVVERHIHDSIAGYPAIFYAAATNNDRILRQFLAFGGDVNTVHEPSQVPLIAFAIAHSETIEKDTSLIVSTLLSMGATPRAIPEAFYTPYFRDLAEDGPSDEELKEVATSTMRWLNQDNRAKLARTCHLTNRYNLERALKTKRPSARHWQIAQRENAIELLGLPYFLIGQSIAAQNVLTELLSNLVVPSKKPLVLVFAGPSGHGKTEMARRLGYLMQTELLVVDCTIVQHEIELFGGRHPYVNADKGTPLNNHLTKYDGERSIVFLDEFEKTSAEVHQALLLPFDNGNLKSCMAHPRSLADDHRRISGPSGRQKD
jgi:hypothetical protein